jgi:hypothetical protein
MKTILAPLVVAVCLFGCSENPVSTNVDGSWSLDCGQNGNVMTDLRGEHLVIKVWSDSAQDCYADNCYPSTARTADTYLSQSVTVNGGSMECRAAPGKDIDGFQRLVFTRE